MAGSDKFYTFVYFMRYYYSGSYEKFRDDNFLELYLRASLPSDYKQAADVLGVSKATLYRYLRTNRAPEPIMILLRIRACGYLPADPKSQWRGHKIVGNELYTPQGHTICPVRIELLFDKLSENYDLIRQVHKFKRQNIKLRELEKIKDVKNLLSLFKFSFHDVDADLF